MLSAGFIGKRFVLTYYAGTDKRLHALYELYPVKLLGFIRGAGEFILTGFDVNISSADRELLESIIFLTKIVQQL